MVENAFGILAHRFRCLLKPFQQDTKNVESIVLAACVLHNLMRMRYPRLTNQLVDREDQDSHEVIPGAWREIEDLTVLQLLRGNNTTKAAKAQRDYLCSFYNSPAGRVPWQDKMI